MKREAAIQKNSIFFRISVTKKLDHLKDGLILIMKCSCGTKYENFKEQLINQIAEKFLRDYATEFINADMLVRVITENLFDGITAIAIQSNTEQELKKILYGFIKYHSYGFLALTSH